MSKNILARLCTTLNSSFQFRTTQYNREKQSSPTRLLLRKILKSWEQKDFDLTMPSQKNRDLERQIVASRASRRKKVQPDPNETFADREAIRRVGRVSDDNDGSKESETPSEARSSIVVATRIVSRGRGRW
jgi:hypothetical protein